MRLEHDIEYFSNSYIQRLGNFFSTFLRYSKVLKSSYKINALYNDIGNNISFSSILSSLKKSIKIRSTNFSLLRTLYAIEMSTMSIGSKYFEFDLNKVVKILDLNLWNISYFLTDTFGVHLKLLFLTKIVHIY